MNRILVVGFGSIGARHARLAAEAGAAVSCVTRNADCPYPRFEGEAAALGEFAPSHAVIASATSLHEAGLTRLRDAGFAGPVLIEKPLFGAPPAEAGVVDPAVWVAYNLRFHPLIARLRQEIGGRRLISAVLHAGQYLPSWRPESDYRTSYSADPSRGGGVLRDLSHELDLALWLFGPWRRVAALGGTFGDLGIRSDDTLALVAEMQNCPVVSVTLNYHDRMPQRRIVINAEGLTADLDLVAGRLTVNGVPDQRETQRDATYRAQLEAFYAGGDDRLATMAEGLSVDRWVRDIERSISGRTFLEAPA